MKKTKVLILSDKSAKFNTQLDFAVSLNDKIDISFLITFQKKIRLIRINEAKKLNIKNSVKQIQSNKASYSFFRYIFHNSFFGFFYYILLIYHYYITIKKLLKVSDFDVIILNGDRSGPSVESSLLLFAKKNNLKVVIPYLSIIGSGEKVRLKNQKLYKVNFLSKYFYRKNSKYVFSHESKNYGFYTLAQYLSLRYFGILTSNPFSIGNNRITNVICVDTKFTFNKIKDKISNHKKVKIVGRPEYDYILNNKVEKKFLLLSLPQLYEHKVVEWDTHIDFIKKIVKTLSEHSKLIINLHPKCKESDYKFLESDFDCIISKNNIKKDVINASTFVCINSSIAIWSVLLGIKTIILDYFNLDLFYLKGLDSLIYVNSETKLKEVLESKKVIDFTNDWQLLGKNYLMEKKSKKRYLDLLKL